MNRNVFRVIEYAFFPLIYFIIRLSFGVVFVVLSTVFKGFSTGCAKLKPKKKHLQYSHTILFKFRINFEILMDVIAGFLQIKSIFGIDLNSCIILDLNPLN